MKRFPFLAVAALAAAASIVETPRAAEAAQSPEAHAGGFNKSTSPANCIRFAKDALRHERYNVWFDTPYTVIGNDDHVMVQVVCAARPSGAAYVVVSAFSSDSRTAELARNAVRTYIAGVVMYDDN